MQQIWLLLDSENDSKQRQNLKKRVHLPTISTPNCKQSANNFVWFLMLKKC